MKRTPNPPSQLQEALERARLEPTISLRDAGLILGRSYNFMLRLILDLEDEGTNNASGTSGVEVFPGVYAYRLGRAPGSHYVVPSLPLLRALGLASAA